MKDREASKTADRGELKLVEAVIGLVILTVAVLAMSTSDTRSGRSALTPERHAAALQAVDDRMSRVLHHPTYTELDSLFDTVEDSVTSYGFERTTDIERRRVEVDGGQMLEYTEITVTVKGPLFGETVSRSAAVAAP